MDFEFWQEAVFDVPHSCFGDVWRDASDNTLDYCIGGMHLTIH